MCVVCSCFPVVHRCRQLRRVWQLQHSGEYLQLRNRFLRRCLSVRLECGCVRCVQCVVRQWWCAVTQRHVCQLRHRRSLRATEWGLHHRCAWYGTVLYSTPLYCTVRCSLLFCTSLSPLSLFSPLSLLSLFSLSSLFLFFSFSLVLALFLSLSRSHSLFSSLLF